MMEVPFLNMPLFDAVSLTQLLSRFFINVVVVLCIIQFFYYRKSRRDDYYLTFMLISVSIFLMIYLLGNIKLKVGFALGLFAIFGIIRYRTESMPMREMTYLFVIIAISVINALVDEISFVELIVTNLLFVASIALLENTNWLHQIPCKIIRYDRIDLIVPERRKELIADLEKRTGLKVVKVEIGHMDLLRDMTMIKMFYEMPEGETSSVDSLTNFPEHEE